MNHLSPRLRIASCTIKMGHHDIHVAECGNGEPLLLLHGGGPGSSGLANFDRNISELARQYHLIVPDLPGFGQSYKDVDCEDPLGDMAAAMLNVLDQMGIGKTHVIGNSLGGACALRMAIESPSRINAQLLAAPGCVNISRTLPTAALRRVLRYYDGDGPTLKKMRSYLSEDLVFDGRSIPDELIIERYNASLAPDIRASGQLPRPKSWRQLIENDFSRNPLIRQCKVPTLVVWGANDRVTRPSGGISLQKLMPDCDLIFFRNTGHWAQWEHAEKFNAQAISFFGLHSMQCAPVAGRNFVPIYPCQG
jgi:pimeloyl-ACP methyl ester carboxylesterase